MLLNILQSTKEGHKVSWTQGTFMNPPLPGVEAEGNLTPHKSLVILPVYGKTDDSGLFRMD